MLGRRTLAILLFLAVLALTFALGGCGDSGSDQAELEQARRQGAAAARHASEIRELREEVSELKSGSAPAPSGGTDEPNSAPAVVDGDSRIPESGTYQGPAQQRGEPARYNKDYPLEMTFSSAGSYVRYPALGCEGSLRPVGFDNSYRIYQESITVGHCDDGGTWSVLVEGPDRLVASWALAGATYTVSAVLTR